jgi:hypothetical protein
MEALGVFEIIIIRLEVLMIHMELMNEVPLFNTK